MNQKTVGLTLRATILALALILVAGSLPLLPLDGVAYAQTGPQLTAKLAPDNSSVQLTWTAISGATDYEVYRQEDGGKWGDAIEVKALTYTDSDVTAGTSYFYIVHAVGSTDWSNTPKVTVPGGTAAPTERPTLRAAVDGLNAISLTWTTVSDADHYDLRRWNGDTNSWDRLGGDLTGNSYSDTNNLESGEQYWYIVRAVNAGGNGPYNYTGGGAYATETLPDTTEKPELSLTHPSRTTVELSWTAVATDAVYVVQRQKTTTAGDGTATVDPAGFVDLADDVTATSYTDNAADFDAGDDGNNQSTSYSYRVYALIDGEQTDYSNVEPVDIPETSARPPTPSGLSVNVGGHDRLTITWFNSVGAASHQLRYKRGTGNYGSATTKTSGWTHTGLSSETEYTYQVRAVNVNGPSDWSSEVSATTSSTTSTSGQLGKPSGLRAVDATDTDTGEEPAVPGIKVTWNRVSNADSYELLAWVGTAWQAVILGAGADEIATTVAKREITVTTEQVADAIAPDTTYYFVIRAIAGTTDRGDWSAPVSTTTDAVQPALGTDEVDHDDDSATALINVPHQNGLDVIARGQSTLWITWDEIGDAAKYTLQWRLSGSTARWNSITVTGATNYAHTGRSSATTYHYRFRAENSGGVSAWSAEAEGQTWARQLSTPTGLKVEDASTVADNGEITTAAIKITWNKVTGATGYELQEWKALADTPVWDDLGDRRRQHGNPSNGWRHHHRQRRSHHFWHHQLLHHPCSERGCQQPMVGPRGRLRQGRGPTSGSAECGTDRTDNGSTHLGCGA